MAISQLSSKDSYRDNPLLKKIGVNVNYTEEQVQEYIKCSNDPIYFAKNYIKIVNVDEGLVNFKMWDFQEQMLTKFKDNRFVITKCPRQVGKCLKSDTYVKIRNKKTGEVIDITVEEFYEMMKEKQKIDLK